MLLDVCIEAEIITTKHGINFVNIPKETERIEIINGLLKNYNKYIKDFITITNSKFKILELKDFFTLIKIANTINNIKK